MCLFKSLCMKGIAEFASRSVFALMTSYFSGNLVLIAVLVTGNISSVFSSSFFVHFRAKDNDNVFLLDLRVSSWHDSRASWYEWYWRHRQVEWQLEMGYCSQSWKKLIQISKRTFAQLSNVPERQFNNFLSHLEVLNTGKSTGCLEKSGISACIIIDLDLLKSQLNISHIFEWNQNDDYSKLRKGIHEP